MLVLCEIADLVICKHCGKGSTVHLCVVYKYNIAKYKHNKHINTLLLFFASWPFLLTV